MYSGVGRGFWELAGYMVGVNEVAGVLVRRSTEEMHR
jgi:hypothetical protein